jgi:hypothetical protein
MLSFDRQHHVLWTAASTGPHVTKRVQTRVERGSGAPYNPGPDQKNRRSTKACLGAANVEGS